MFVDDARGDVAAMLAGALATAYLLAMAMLASLLCCVGDFALWRFVEAMALTRSARGPRREAAPTR